MVPGCLGSGCLCCTAGLLPARTACLCRTGEARGMVSVWSAVQPGGSWPQEGNELLNLCWHSPSRRQKPSPAYAVPLYALITILPPLAPAGT